MDKKIKKKDFKVFLGPGFKVGRQTFRVVVDGHHAYEASVRLIGWGDSWRYLDNKRLVDF